MTLMPRFAGTVTPSPAALVEASVGATNFPALFFTEA